MKIKTIIADSSRELDQILNDNYLNDGWELLGELSVYSEPHPHAVTSEEIWDNKFAQRVKKDESKQS